jgi:hypothetical protein
MLSSNIHEFHLVSFRLFPRYHGRLSDDVVLAIPHALTACREIFSQMVLSPSNHHKPEQFGKSSLHSLQHIIALAYALGFLAVKSV